MSTHRTHIVIPDPIVDEIDRLVGKRRRSEFLVQAAERELLRLRQIRALEKIGGAWKERDHPELKRGAARWVKELRKESDLRFERAAPR
jgi:Arc/MetJ-type ribon-helix-helix transcriptional regulator